MINPRHISKKFVILIAFLAMLTACSGEPATPAGTLPPSAPETLSSSPTPTDPSATAASEVEVAAKAYFTVLLKGLSSNDTSFDFSKVATGVALKGATRTLALNAGRGGKVTATGTISNILLLSIDLKSSPPKARTSACTYESAVRRTSGGKIDDSSQGYFVSTMDFEKTVAGWRVSRASGVEDLKNICPHSK
jgi:hypothetical protein